jgi:hypothetical protein
MTKSKAMLESGSARGWERFERLKARTMQFARETR